MTRQQTQKIAVTVISLVAALVVIPIILVIVFIIVNGLPAISWTFLTQPPSNGMREGGIMPAVLGTVLLTFGTAIAAFPLAIGQVGPVVSIDSGHLIIMKVVSIPQRLRPLSEVADEIRSELLTERRRRVLRMFLTSERRSQGFGGDPVSVP